MKELEKYKIAPQAKFVKFKVKHFVQIPNVFCFNIWKRWDLYGSFVIGDSGTCL